MRSLVSPALPALALALALAAPGCAAPSEPAPDKPREARGPDTSALEGSIARLERRQLEHIQRQRELEIEVAELTEALERLAEGLDRERAIEDPAPRAQRRRDPPRRPGRPDPGAVYAVPTGGSPAHGPADALVTIVMATEFSCPFCHRVRPTLDELREEYGGDLRIVYKHFIVHPQRATTPALAACAAHKQGRHEAMEPLIWERGYERNRDLSEDNMKRIARDIGLDMARFEADMNGRACREKLRKDQALMRRLGTRGTPNFYINGRPLAGAQPIDRFRALIDEERDKAKARIAEGTAPSDYYRRWVLGEGKSSL